MPTSRDERCAPLKLGINGYRSARFRSINK